VSHRATDGVGVGVGVGVQVSAAVGVVGRGDGSLWADVLADMTGNGRQ
jgi:hypothetical protein